MTRSCGGCQSFIKWKNDQDGGGLCEMRDARTTSDGGSGCLYYRVKPYDKARYRAEFHRAVRAYLRGEAA